MFKKTVTYEDWNGVERTEDFYFNLTRVELAELEYSSIPGESMTDHITDLMKSRDMGVVIKTIKQMLLMSYGVKSPDGKRFVKNDEVRTAFEENPAFDILYMELATDADAAAEFVAGIMPSALRDKLGDNPKQELLNRANEQAVDMKLV